MKQTRLLTFLISILFVNGFSQDGFQFTNNKQKIVIPFKSINNLIFIPINVNGVELNFLLDTGVKETILFSLDDKQEISFENVQKIKLKGFGNDEFVEGLKSSNNTLTIKNFRDTNHIVYIVLDQNFNLSSQVGIPVNGIIGYNFFINYMVETDYQKNRIIIYKNDLKIRKKLSEKFISQSIKIQNSKPVIETKLTLDDDLISTNLLIDSGNSDAFWLFQNLKNNFKVPSKNIIDYLGHGFSGAIFGKRAKIKKVAFNEFQFNNPIVSFPDTLDVKKSSISEGREGSIGAEILKRFDVVYDYLGEKIYFKKNANFNLPFNFNKSGIEIQQDGLQWVKGTEEIRNTLAGGINFDINSDKITNFRYKFDLKPIFKIASIRKNSPAEAIGLKKDDIIIEINKEEVYRYSLQEINELLKSDERTSIYIIVERNNKQIKFKFQLKDAL